MHSTFKIVLLFFLVTGTVKAQTPTATKETKITEVVTTDSVPSSELLKRAVNWVKVETPRYTKTSGVTAGSKAECNISFPVKPKELNPVCDYTGKITMKVVVECKDSKYRYTVDQIKHISTGGKTSVGNIDNIIPECGSMVMPDLTVKKLKGEALKYANVVVNDIKESMKVSSDAMKKEEW